MNDHFYQTLLKKCLSGEIFSTDTCLEILSSPKIELLELVQTAFIIRKKYFGKVVLIHVLNNVQNGSCSEDCRYCAQSKSSKAAIQEYALKSDTEILGEAKRAYENGAFRYCLVFSGQGPGLRRIEHLCGLIREIKSRFPLEVCVSPGIIDADKIMLLKHAGLDRLNHNINTSETFYPRICTTHGYQDRLNTLQAARQCHMPVCSGIIVGMGEKDEDVVEMAKTLQEMEVRSIPVNFYLPIDGNALELKPDLSPEYCLRVLSLLRLMNPKAEIRVAAGREIYLRSMEALSLFPANSLFMEGYLNSKGWGPDRTLQMIRDAGFQIKSDFPLEELLNREAAESRGHEDSGDLGLKNFNDLRPLLGKSQA